MKKKKVINKPKQEYVLKAPYANARFNPENIKEVTAEYIYYKAFIQGLERAKGLKDVEIQALIDIYSVKTKNIDEFLESEGE